MLFITHQKWKRIQKVNTAKKNRETDKQKSNSLVRVVNKNKKNNLLSKKKRKQSL
jgi:hypothetical protein